MSTTQQVTVSRTIYKSTILIYNEAGEVVKHLYAYMDDPGPAGVGVGAIVGDGDPSGVFRPGDAE